MYSYKQLVVGLKEEGFVHIPNPEMVEISPLGLSILELVSQIAFYTASRQRQTPNEVEVRLGPRGAETK